MGLNPSKLSGRLVFFVIFASLFFLNSCSKIVSRGKSSSQSLTSVPCLDSSGNLATRQMSISGPSDLNVNSSGAFSIFSIEDCENINSIAWQAGDGTAPNNSSGKNYSHTYALPGLYTLLARVIDKVPNTYTLQHLVSVKSNCAGVSCVAVKEVFISGPHSGIIENSYSFQLILPAGFTPQSVVWDFKDATVGNNTGNPLQEHIYVAPGVYDIVARVTDSTGNIFDAKHRISISSTWNAAPFPPSCTIEQAELSSPTIGYINQNLPFYAHLPDCLADVVSNISWDFGDTESAGANQSVTHAYDAVGYYPVTVNLYRDTNPSTPFMQLLRWVHILDGTPPTPLTPLTPPTSNLPCTNEGQAVNHQSDIYSILEACGVDGTKSKTMRDDFTLTCQSTVSGLLWMETSRSPQLLSEGTCQNESCEIPNEAQGACNANDPLCKQISGKWYQPHGSSRTYYASMLPKKSCSDVSATRTCNNKVLSNQDGACGDDCPGGVAFYIYLSCINGCKDVPTVGGATVNLSSGETSAPFFTANYDEPQSCSNGGTKTNTYKDQLSKTCNNGNVSQATLQNHILVIEGPCTGQSCTANGITVGAGQTKTFYSTSSPDNVCTTVSQDRTCDGTTGVLSGTNTYTQGTCTNGCVGFGANGSTKLGQVIGTLTEDKVCDYGETGILDTYEKLADQICQAGTISNSNERKGALVTLGNCPEYNWSLTSWSECTADCGGTQTPIYTCKDPAGNTVDSARCANSPVAALESRVCDGNPTLTRIVETPQTQDSASCTACPANQIGIVYGTRINTLRNTQSCLSHSYQTTYTQTVYGSWTYRNYCRDFTNVRCGNDNLYYPNAVGRYQWMQKCRTQVPTIDEFLTNFATVTWSGWDQYGAYQTNTSLTSGNGSSNTRRLYPTFWNATTNQAWIAPTTESASCTVPNGIFVTAVCVSGCVTPEEQILASIKDADVESPLTFLEALNSKAKYAAVLSSLSTSDNLQRQLMPVDQWITDFTDAKHPILVVRTQSGASIKVTPNHPLVDGDGIMREASTFNVGDSLVRSNGERDRIISIEETEYFGKVYNLFMKSDLPEDNIVITNGFLNGTNLFQNDDSEYLNRELLRQNLIKDAVK